MSAPFSCVNSCAVQPKINDRDDAWPIPLQISHSSRSYEDKENQISRDILLHQHMGFKYMTEDAVEKYTHRKRQPVSVTQVPDLAHCNTEM